LLKTPFKRFQRHTLKKPHTRIPLIKPPLKRSILPFRASIYAPQYFYIATPHKTPLNAFATVLKAMLFLTKLDTKTP